jgi:hypothetical protein
MSCRAYLAISGAVFGAVAIFHLLRCRFARWIDPTFATWK